LSVTQKERVVTKKKKNNRGEEVQTRLIVISRGGANKSDRRRRAKKEEGIIRGKGGRVYQNMPDVSARFPTHHSREKAIAGSAPAMSR